jgi:hypothetical protein
MSPPPLPLVRRSTSMSMMTPSDARLTALRGWRTSVRRIYIYGPGGLPTEQINNSSGAVTYLHHDQSGSTRQLTGSTGTVTGKCTYGAYGTPTCEGSATTPLGFDTVGLGARPIVRNGRARGLAETGFHPMGRGILGVRISTRAWSRLIEI